ncbi:MAG: NAD(+) synthase [Clostridia bacterium]|nr:NAD(+) synthase [Clostridia bacterium]
MNYGFLKVGAVSPELRVTDCDFNSTQIINAVKKYDEKVSYLLFPELSVTGYTCADLFFQTTLLKSAENALFKIVDETRYTSVVFLVGMPVKFNNRLFNVAVVIQSGNILGVVPKSYLPNYSEFYEERWFSSGKDMHEEINLLGFTVPFSTNIIFTPNGREEASFAVEICEDLWATIPPSSYHVKKGAHLIFNLSASNELVAKYEYRKQLLRQHSASAICGYIYCSSNINESSTDLVYGGHTLIAENGRILEEGKRFSFGEEIIISEIDVELLAHDRAKNTVFMEDDVLDDYFIVPYNLNEIDIDQLTRLIEKTPFVPGNPDKLTERCEEIFSIQSSGLAKRMKHIGNKKAVLAISGGLDSTLALLVTVKAFEKLGLDKKNIIAITMPGFGTTDRTYDNAVKLIELLGVEFREIDIKPACLLHFDDIGHDKDIHDVTYENVQARERYQIAFDIANKDGGIVVGTGDLSELALGWCTYNGDHMSMYSVNSSVPKTLVKYLIGYVAETQVDKSIRKVLIDIMDTPISPELLPPHANGDIKQRTEDILGPYEVHDFFLYNMIRKGYSPSKMLFLASQAFHDSYDETSLHDWLTVFIKRFFSQQFKRSCIPDGPKVGSINLSPRGDWRMPSDASAAIWLKELEE